ARQSQAAGNRDARRQDQQRRREQDRATQRPRRPQPHRHAHHRRPPGRPLRSQPGPDRTRQVALRRERNRPPQLAERALAIPVRPAGRPPSHDRLPPPRTPPSSASPRAGARAPVTAATSRSPAATPAPPPSRPPAAPGSSGTRSPIGPPAAS